MKSRPTLVKVVALTALGALIVLAFLLPLSRRPRAKGGPGIHGNLRLIEMNKATLLAGGNTSEWPSAQDVLGAPPGKTANEVLFRRGDELYFINRTGAPPFVYVPEPGSQYRRGKILILLSNQLVAVPQ